MIPHAEKPRIYPSVKKDSTDVLKDGQNPKQATFNLTKRSGGLDKIKDANAIPKITQV